MLGRQCITTSLYESIVQRYARLQIALAQVPFSSAASADVVEDHSKPEVKDEYPKPDPKFAEIIRALTRDKTKRHISEKLRKAGRIPSIVFECEKGEEGGNKRIISVETKQIRNLIRKMGESFFKSRTFDIEVRAASDSEDVVEKGRVFPRLVHIKRSTDEILNITFIRAPSHALLKVDVPLLYRGEDACKSAPCFLVENVVKKYFGVLFWFFHAYRGFAILKIRHGQDVAPNNSNSKKNTPTPYVKRLCKYAPCFPVENIVKKASNGPSRTDSFHVVYKVPAGDTPDVKAKHEQRFQNSENGAEAQQQ